MNSDMRSGLKYALTAFSMRVNGVAFQQNVTEKPVWRPVGGSSLDSISTLMRLLSMWITFPS